MRRVASNTAAAGAAEFALVLPLLLVLMFGIIDAGRLMWTINRAEKAAQIGVRRAAVTDAVASGLKDYSFALDYTPAMEPGTTVSTAQFGAVRCGTTSTSANATCSCLATPCPGTTGTSVNTDAFNATVTRMQGIFAELRPQDVQFTYSNVGLGFAGNPYGFDMAPLVTVEISGAQFTPITTMVFRTSFNLPTIRSSMPLEDGVGSVSN